MAHPNIKEASRAVVSREFLFSERPGGDTLIRKKFAYASGQGQPEVKPNTFLPAFRLHEEPLSLDCEPVAVPEEKQGTPDARDFNAELAPKHELPAPETPRQESYELPPAQPEQETPLVVPQQHPCNPEIPEQVTVPEGTPDARDFNAELAPKHELPVPETPKAPAQPEQETPLVVPQQNHCNPEIPAQGESEGEGETGGELEGEPEARGTLTYHHQMASGLRNNKVVPSSEAKRTFVFAIWGKERSDLWATIRGNHGKPFDLISSLIKAMDLELVAEWILSPGQSVLGPLVASLRGHDCTRMVIFDSKSGPLFREGGPGVEIVRELSNHGAAPTVVLLDMEKALHWAGHLRYRDHRPPGCIFAFNPDLRKMLSLLCGNRHLAPDLVEIVTACTEEVYPK